MKRRVVAPQMKKIKLERNQSKHESKRFAGVWFFLGHLPITEVLGPVVKDGHGLFNENKNNL